MKYIIIIIAILLTGCVNIEEAIKKVPNNEFTKFTYSRQGNVTSATITATGAKKEGDKIKIEDFHMTLNYGVVTWDVMIEGLIVNPEELETR
jgi:hypothetical protein